MIISNYSSTDSGIRSRMRDYVDAEHIRHMILEGTVERASATVSAKAEDHLKRCFPLNTKTTTWVVDWDAIPSTSIEWSEVPDDAVLGWARKTLAGGCMFGLLLINSDQPCLVGEFDVMIRHLDEMVWAAAGNRLMFGVERDPDGGVKFGAGVIEFNGKDTLRGSI